ncbi:LysR family transcriptional regulator [Ensifer adhaerens]|uniref:LysR family transcriptional regulator n=1 Tax=Ensifer adhaerens TaxID=106592 RepID=UPI001CBCE893|nr:LysR family transcriptional regulator [Ensifer adhaerens]MBZ7926366.1 LysR family transcriptional regulator [Ensifer adhaerens]UAX97275.1 LysR family transcriptional regulator [Ensifer adhaerens]UAY03606.1 LysR family transcriptional regulator [Ensifer adhaerens]UAY11590.1 LysR family transcriptional regulator [Ensifer adhaerens]
MKLRQLAYFVKVVEVGNITRAAEQLNLAQTALGIQIRNLEDSLQIQLLDRHSRGVSATPAGMLLYERAIEILQRIEETRRDLIALGGEKVRIRFGATPSILKLIGTELLVAANAQLPNIALEVVEELSFVLTDALERGELDYVLAYDIEDNPGVRRVALLEEELLHVAAPSGKDEEGDISFRQAVAGDLALVSNRDIIWKRVQETASRLSVDVKITYQVQSNEAIKALVLHGVAQSIMPYGIVAEEVKKGLITARRIARPAVKRTLFLAHPSHRGFADEKPFLAFIDRMVDRLTVLVGPYAHTIDRLLPVEQADFV